MHCSRCHGTMTLERFCDQYDETGQLCFMGWRCLTCGEVVDPVIMRNRRERAATVSKRHRPRRRYDTVV
jgi:uncharacterized Zn finger protein